MGLFGLFKKKKQSEPAIKHAYAQESGNWEHGSVEQAAMQPMEQKALRGISPMEQLKPQAMDRPSSLNEAEMQTLLSKLDLISSRLEMINQRLINLERAFQQPPAETYQQSSQQTPQQVRRW